MRLRQVLIVHSSRAVSSTVKRYVLSDLSDIAFTETESGKDALENLQNKKFEVVIADNDLFDMNGPALHEKRQGIELNKETPFILLVPSDGLTLEYIEQLNQAGIVHYLSIPFTAKEIISKINNVCNPRTWRANDRFHIPKSKAYLHLERELVEIDLINISLGGVLCEFFYDYQVIELLGTNRISIYIPSSGGYFEIADIKCKLSRLNVVNWKADGMAEHVRMTFLFTGLSLEIEGLILQVVKMAEEMELFDKGNNLPDDESLN